MATHSESITILRRILYTTTLLFAIYSLTTIIILVHSSQQHTSIPLSTALILLSILLAFLFLFILLILLWRRANHAHKSRHNRDIESRWARAPDGARYLLTDQELKALQKAEKRQRRERDRHNSTWRHIIASNARIGAGAGANTRGLDISSPRNPYKEGKGEPMVRNAPPTAPGAPLLQAHEFTNQGIFGGRLAMGGGLNPNFGLSPPTSPRSPPRREVRGMEGRVVGAREVGAKEGQVANNERGKEGGGCKEETRQGPEAGAAAVSGLSIPRKDIGSPPREKGGKRVGGGGGAGGASGARIATAHGAASGATIGLAGERVTGMQSHKLPSGIVGYGLLAISQEARVSQIGEAGKTVDGRDVWRWQNGVYAHRRDGELSVVSEERTAGSGGLRGSGLEGRSWEEMTADEVERERRWVRERRALETAERAEAVKSDATVEVAKVEREPAKDLPYTKRGAAELERERKQTHTQKKKIRARLNAERVQAARQKKEQQEAQFMQSKISLEAVQREGDSSATGTRGMQHRSAIPPGLALKASHSHSSAHLRLPELGVRDSASLAREMAGNQETLSWRAGKTGNAPREEEIGTVSWLHPYLGGNPADAGMGYQPPVVEDGDWEVEGDGDGHKEGELTEWQARKRAEAWARLTEEGAARKAVVDALQPPPTLEPLALEAVNGEVDVEGNGELKEDSLESWHTLYKADARERGVRGFTCTTSTSVVEGNERFPSFSEIMQERERVRDAAAKVEGESTEGMEGGKGDKRAEGSVSQVQVEVRSLHSTERGTMLSRLNSIGQPPASALQQYRSHIPRRAVVTRTGTETVKGAGVKTGVKTGGTKAHLAPGMFGYQNASKGNTNLPKKKTGDANTNGRTWTPPGTGAGASAPRRAGAPADDAGWV